MLKRILITGASGQLGSAVIKALSSKHDLLATDAISNDGIIWQVPFFTLDITNAHQIKTILHDTKPDVIINLATMTDVDDCENNPTQAELVNTTAVGYLIEHFSGQFIQISTDYVFDGKAGPYNETDKTNPISVYGKTKLDAETIVQRPGKDWVILRTNVLFDYYPGTQASFIKWVIDSLRAGKIINVVDDQWNNPTWTHSLAEIIELVIENDVQGLYNYGGADYLNRFDFARLIANIFDLNESLIMPIKTKYLKQPAQRPLLGGVKTAKIENYFNIKCADLRETLIKIKTQTN